MKRKVRYDRIVLCIVVLIFIIILLCTFIKPKKENEKIKFNERDVYVASATLKTNLYDLNYVESEPLIRGTKVTILSDKTSYLGKDYYKIRYNNIEYYILINNTADNIKDTVLETTMYVRTSATVYKNETGSEILSFVKKGSKLDIVGYDKMNADGSINMYKIKVSDGIGYVYAKYLTSTLEESILNYDEAVTYEYHKNRKFSYDLMGGSAANLDYYPYEKPNFENNVMPKEAKTLYLNGSSGTIGNIESYINMAKGSGINAFVVDIKDGYMAYSSEVAKKYSERNYKSASNSYDKYKKAISRLKEEGFYVIGRITTFNDSNFAKDNPTETIASNAGVSTGWVSAYSRLAWEFNVMLAREAVTEFGFNEIQFDYVRFPESSYSYSKNNYDYKNKYNEEKAQTIQNYLMYAADEIHKLNAYVSADVFGECVGTYVTAYGQYWPAISNVVDVISAMPYPDHFSKGSYGISIPWTDPYSLMKSWASGAVNRQKEIPTPSKVRTWIQAYNTIHEPYITYDSDMITNQIKGLYDAGLRGGYITWNGGSSLEKYTSLKPAFAKEY